jgi:hypothetical protein
MSIAKATGEGITLEIKGKKYKLLPATIGDLALFEQHIKENKIALIMKTVKEEKMQFKLIEKVMELNLSGNDIDKAMETMEGSAFMLWRSLRHNKLTLDEAKELIDVSNMKTISIAIAGLVGTPEKK